jgi:hypothetical protein
MKKLFIGLLIIAAGAGIFYFLQQDKKKPDNRIEKELLVGKWKIDSIYNVSKDTSWPYWIVAFKDSALHQYHFDFQKEGGIVQSREGSVAADTSYFEWKKNELLIKDAAKDSSGESFAINRLVKDTLILQSKDSALFVLTRVN